MGTMKMKIKKKFTNILLIIFIGAFIYSAYMCFTWLKSDRETKKLEEGLYAEVVQKVEKSEENGEENNNLPEEKIDFEKLLSINEDVVAWIKIDNTYINYPILQGETDEYYLKKDIYRKYSVSGSIFVDTTTNINFYDHNTVIYGHNMKNERMFADLHKIKNGALGTDIKVKIYTKNTSSTYQVFSAYAVEPSEDLVEKNFSNESDKQAYINKALNKSNVKFDINKENINYENNVITLITCDNNNKYRVIVHAIENI